MPTSHHDRQTARRRHTLRPVIWFLCGLILGGLTIVLVRPPGNVGVPEAGLADQMRPPFRSQPHGELAYSEQNPRPGKRSSGGYLVKSTDEPQLHLRAQLFDYAISETLAGFLSGLSDEQSNSLSTALGNLQLRLNEHEAQKAKVTYESSEKVTLSVPALYVGPDAASQFRDELAGTLGPELADGFLRSSARDLDLRFAFWGTADQEIDIDLTRDPAYITQRIKNEGRLATYGTEYHGAGHRFAHLFEIVEPHEDVTR